MKVINFLKGIIIYVTMCLGMLFIGIDTDLTPFTNIIIFALVLGVFGFITYRIVSTSTEDEIKTYMGINYIKNKFGVDLLSED